MFNDTDLPKSSVENPDTGFDAGAEPSAAAPPVRFGRLALCVATASALAFGVVGTVAYGIWFNHDQQAYADAMANARQALGTAASAAIGPASAKSITPSGAATFAAAPQSATPVTKAVTAAVTTAAAAGRTASGMQTPVATPPVTTGTQAVPGGSASAQMQATAAESDGEEGSKQASWSGPVTRLPTPAASQTSIADATPAAAAPAVASAQRPPRPSQQLAAGRSGKDTRLAQQDRRSYSTANARHKGSLFARVSSFFRRVSYRPHGTGSQQDTYSHP